MKKEKLIWRGKKKRTRKEKRKPKAKEVLVGTEKEMAEKGKSKNWGRGTILLCSALGG
jgi:hypothetical protein